MQKLIWKLLPPYEVRLTREEVRAFLSNVGACRSIVERKVLGLASDAEKTVCSIRIDRMKPDQLALILITNVVGAELGSGTHHVYRGVLGAIGRDMQSLWTAAQTALLQRGYCDALEVEKDNAWLRDQIKAAG
ncbi:MAG: hypothetical protein Q7T39_22070 [Polaromonas sp.]|nr:hypothetical protein [Polaromonas sp.]